MEEYEELAEMMLGKENKEIVMILIKQTVKYALMFEKYNKNESIEWGNFLKNEMSKIDDSKELDVIIEEVVITLLNMSTKQTLLISQCVYYDGVEKKKEYEKYCYGYLMNFVQELSSIEEMKKLKKENPQLENDVNECIGYITFFESVAEICKKENMDINETLDFIANRIK